MVRVIVTAVFALLMFAPASQAQDCGSLGKPSFSAVRTLKEGNRVVGRGAVYISPDGERQENRLGANKEFVILNSRGRYVWVEGRSDGLFFPKPAIPRTEAPQIQTEKVGANTRFTEIVKTDSGALGRGSSVLCSPQGVPLRRELVVVDDRGRTKRLVIEHSNIRLQRLPRSLFRPPSNIRFQTVRK